MGWRLGCARRSGLALCIAELAIESRFRDCGDFVARPWHWSEYRDLPAAECSPIAQPSGTQSGRAGVLKTFQQPRTVRELPREFPYFYQSDMGTDPRSSATFFRHCSLEL